MGRINKRRNKNIRVCIVVLLIVFVGLAVYMFLPKDDMQTNSGGSFFSEIGEALHLDQISEIISNDLTISEEESLNQIQDNPTDETTVNSYTSSVSDADFSLDLVPDYSDFPYYVVNNNEPYFTKTETESYAKAGYEYYSPLDNFGRCGVTMAFIGQETMPTEKRGDISKVKPSGWHNENTYDFIDGKKLYNRCHLIGFQLAGENANEQNLITGTRYLNVVGMLPFENEVADYVRMSNGHVLYRVTPIFEGNNLVADGVLMEGKSYEDDGESVEFCVFCYNVQPGVFINYSTGKNHAE